MFGLKQLIIFWCLKINMMKKIVLNLLLVFIINLGFAQGTWMGESSNVFTYDLLSTTANPGGVGIALPNYTAGAAIQYAVSNLAAPGFLPYPSSGFSSVSTNINGGGFNLANGALTITAATIASNNTNKFTVYNAVGPTAVSSLFFTINFNTPTATAGAIIYAFGNSASSTTSNNIFNTFNTGASAGMWNSAAATGIFNYLRWDLAATNAIVFSYRLGAAGSYAASSINSSTFLKTGGAYNIELYCNNSTAAQTYVRGTSTYTLPQLTFNIWVNNSLISSATTTNFPSTAEAPSGTAINSFGLTANRNTVTPALTATISGMSIKYVGPSPSITGTATTTAFTTTYGTASVAQTFPVSGANLSSNITATAPSGFLVSNDGANYGSTATFVQSSGSASGTLSVRLSAVAPVAGSYNSAAIVLSSGTTTANITTSATGNAVGQQALTALSTTASKVYDGTVTAGIVTVGAVTGLVGNETLGISTTASNYSSANVGSYPTGIAYNLTNGTGLATNYSMANLSVNGSITAQTIAVTPSAGQSKATGSADPIFTYTASPAIISPNTFSGLLSRDAGETQGAYAIKQGTLNPGSNYTLNFITGNTFSIVTVVAPTVNQASTSTAFTTTYGSASAVQSFVVSGINLTANILASAPAGYLVSNDGITFGSTATFIQSGGSVNGTLSVVLAATAVVAGSYNSNNITLSSTGATSVVIITTASGNIVSPKPLTLTGIRVNSRSYNGLTAATLSGNASYLGLQNGEIFNVTGTSVASFTTPIVGIGKAVSVIGYVAPSSNYAVLQPTALTGTITTAVLSISGVTIYSKAYDGLSSAMVGGTLAYVGLQNNETFSVIGTGSANYTTASVGNTKSAAITGFLPPTSNYLLSQPVGITGNITTAPLTITGISVVAKQYDGISAATLSGVATYVGLQNGETFTVSGTVSANFNNSTIANGKTVTVTGYLAPNANYSCSQPIGLLGNIIPLNITITPIAGQSKIVGRLDSIFTFTSSPSLFSPDVITGLLGRVAGETIGNYAFTLGNLSVGSNYNLVLSSSTSFSVTTAPVINTADFRTKTSGNFSAISTWQYNTGNNIWADATQLPTATNNIAIVNGNILKLDQNYTVSSGKQLLISAGSLEINPSITLNVALSGTINFNNQLVIIKSTIAGNGSIGAILGTLSGATNITVEHYIPNNGFRAWWLLSVPTYGNGQTIRQAWQEGVVNPNPLDNNLANFGTQISGTGTIAAAQAAGFDSTDINAGMLGYNGNNFIGVSSTNAAMATTQGYLLYVRGERSKGTTGAVSNSSATTLKTNGTVYQGNQMTASIPANSFGLVGNLYPSAIDFSKLSLAGGTSKLFYVLDSKKHAGASQGVYQTFSATNNNLPLIDGGSYTMGQSNFAIQAGQAFFVHTGNAAGTVTLTEASKISSNTTTPPAALVKIDSRLYSVTDTGIYDANVVVFNNAYSNAVDSNDAIKLMNTGENLSVQRGNNLLVVEGRQPIINSDTIMFNLMNMQKQQYRFEFVPSNLAISGLTASLQDSYLNSSILLDLSTTTKVSFGVDANAASAATNRFKIVFAQAFSLPLTFTSLVANRIYSGVQVNWMVTNENGILNYQIESSTDSINFSPVGIVEAVGNAASLTHLYRFIDVTTALGQVYYRIKILHLYSEFDYSNIVKVLADNTLQGFFVYPNPVIGGMANLQFRHQPVGDYAIHLVNSNGQLVFGSTISHLGGSSVHVCTLPFGMATGIYKLTITAPDHSTVTENILVTNK